VLSSVSVESQLGVAAMGHEQRKSLLIVIYLHVCTAIQTELVPFISIG